MAKKITDKQKKSEPPHKLMAGATENSVQGNSLEPEKPVIQEEGSLSVPEKPRGRTLKSSTSTDEQENADKLKIDSKLPLPPLTLQDEEILINEIAVGKRFRPVRRDKLDEIKYSIQREGLLQPILVTRAETGYRLVAGQHRLQACKELDHPRIKVRIVEGDTDPVRQEALELAENIFRNDLSLIERSFHIVTYLKKDSLMDSLSADKKSELLGVARRTLFNYMKIATLDELSYSKILQLKQEVRESKTQLLALVKIEPKHCHEILDKLSEAPKLTFGEAYQSVIPEQLSKPNVVFGRMSSNVYDLLEKYLEKENIDKPKGEKKTIQQVIDACVLAGLKSLDL